MLHKLVLFVKGLMFGFIAFTGYPGIIFLMALESACFPVPSEIVMTIAGALAFEGKMTLWGVTLAGAVGCMLGSALSYWVGMHKGRDWAMKYGRYILISHHDMAMAERWFKRWGQPMVFLARLLPVIRTFISLPAGIYRMKFPLFITLSFIGSVPWCYFLAWIGFQGKKTQELWSPWFHRFEYVIVALVLAAGIWWVKRHLKHGKLVVEE